MSLNNVVPTYDALVQRFQSELRDKQAWKDVFPGSVGETLIEFMAAICEYGQHSIGQYAREVASFDTARRNTSVYTLARFLGVRVSRKQSPSVYLTVSRETADTTLVIPPWTEWSYDDKVFVNLAPVIMNINQLSATVLVHNGTVRQQQHVSDGSLFQSYRVIGTGPFTVSDQNVEVRVNDRTWRIVTDGLWNYGAEAVVQDSTLGNGDAFMLFGDDRYGTAPNSGDIITFKWLDTAGLSTDQVLSGRVVATTIAGVTALTASNWSGGANEKHPDTYRAVAPFVFNERNKPYTTEGYEAKIIEYPGVVDVRVLAQRDVDPYDVRLMNVIYVSALLESNGTWYAEVDTPAPPTFLAVNGTLIPSTYTYRVSAINTVGESAACPATNFVLNHPGGLLLRWPLVENAVGYRVYGRTAGVEHFIEECYPTSEDTALGTMQWVDLGVISPLSTTVAPSTNTTKADWYTFTQWMSKYKHASIRLVQRNPTPVAVEVNVDLYFAKSVLDLEVARLKAYNSILSLFTPKKGTIGRQLAASDIVYACKEAQDYEHDVDFIKVNAPVDSVLVLPSATSFFYLSSIVVTAQYSDRRR